MLPDAVLVIDLGTSSVRASILDHSGTVVGVARRALAVRSPSPGAAEQSADEWWRGSREAIAEVVATAGKDWSIAAITVTNQQISTVPLDENYVPLDQAILWLDQRSAGVVDELPAGVADAVREKIGIPPSSSWAPTRLLWWAKERPEIHRRARWFLTADAYLHLRLSGRVITDPSNACFSLMNSETGEYDTDLATAVGIDTRTLPAIMDSGSVLGTITEEVAAQTGLSPGTLVIVGGSDQPCAAIGVGALSPSQLAVTSGTGTFVVRHITEPIMDERLMTNRAAGRRSWLHLGVHYVSGAAWTWLTNVLFGEDSDSTAQERQLKLLRLAETASRLQDRPITLPYFQGARTPRFDDRARGVIFGLDLASTRGDLANSFMESNGFGVRQIVAVLDELGEPTTALHLSGGPAASDFWCQLQSDATGLRCVRTADAEATTLGAALIALVALGVYESLTDAVAACVRVDREFHPDPNLSEIYSERYARYGELYQQVKGLFL